MVDIEAHPVPLRAGVVLDDGTFRRALEQTRDRVDGDVGDGDVDLVGLEGDKRAWEGSDWDEVNMLAIDLRRATLEVIDEDNRQRLTITIAETRDEVSRVNALIEDTAFELAAIDAGESTDSTATAAENSSMPEDEPFDRETFMAELDMELPESVVLINPEPSIKEGCDPTDINPAYILVDDRSKCTDP